MDVTHRITNINETEVKHQVKHKLDSDAFHGMYSNFEPRLHALTFSAGISNQELSRVRVSIFLSGAETRLENPLWLPAVVYYKPNCSRCIKQLHAAQMSYDMPWRHCGSLIET